MTNKEVMQMAIELGLFDSLEDAGNAVAKAREKYHGEFAKKG